LNVSSAHVFYAQVQHGADLNLTNQQGMTPLFNHFVNRLYWQTELEEGNQCAELARHMVRRT
jgi:hypothetical protein